MFWLIFLGSSPPFFCDFVSFLIHDSRMGHKTTINKYIYLAGEIIMLDKSGEEKSSLRFEVLWTICIWLFVFDASLYSILFQIKGGLVKTWQF